MVIKRLAVYQAFRTAMFPWSFYLSPLVFSLLLGMIIILGTDYGGGWEEMMGTGDMFRGFFNSVHDREELGMHGELHEYSPWATSMEGGEETACKSRLRTG